MKVEKRSNPGESAETPPVEKDRKPVIVYIMVMFIAAFLLMALSFFTHQRSNTEALGRLQSSVTVMQEVQDLQEQVISLQKELAESKEAADQFQTSLDGAADSLSHVEHILEETQTALDQFWQLNQAYLQEDFAQCRTILDELDTEFLTDLTAERCQEIQTGLEAWEAAQTEAAP